MKFAEIIKKVNSDKRLVADLMKSEKGNNFRAISESAILDVIDPILSEAEIFYTIDIKEQHLDIREAYGSKGKKLQFIATLSVQLNFFHFVDEDYDFICSTEAVGMGIDDNDKAMGKAYTYAIKYALLKLFRLRYGDDPDAKASEPLYLDKPKEAPAPKKEEKPAAKKSSSGEKMMTENQRDYILGMLKSKNIPESVVIGKFHVEPSYDEDITMRTARAIIQFLEEQPANEDDLPF